MTIHAFAAIGSTVYVETDDGKIAAVTDGNVVHLDATPDQWFKFNGGYAVDPTADMAQAAERAVQP